MGCESATYSKGGKKRYKGQVIYHSIDGVSGLSVGLTLRTSHISSRGLGVGTLLYPGLSTGVGDLSGFASRWILAVLGDGWAGQSRRAYYGSAFGAKGSAVFSSTHIGVGFLPGGWSCHDISLGHHDWHVSIICVGAARGSFHMWVSRRDSATSSIASYVVKYFHLC